MFLEFQETYVEFAIFQKHSTKRKITKEGVLVKGDKIFILAQSVSAFLLYF